MTVLLGQHLSQYNEYTTLISGFGQRSLAGLRLNPFAAKQARYLWVYIDDRKNVVFDFTPTRSREGPINFLVNYCGHVQADAYSGYDAFFNKGKATEVGCNAHARRKFEYAIDSDPVRAARMMALFSRLYEIERRARKEKYDSTQLLKARQTKAMPILAEMKSVLHEDKDQVLPKGPMSKAINYALNQWDALTRYTDDA